MRKFIFLLVYFLISISLNAQKSHLFGMIGDSRIFIHKGLEVQINRATNVSELRIWNEMIGSFYKFKGKKWGFETSLSTSFNVMDNFENWDVSHYVSSITLGANYDLGKMILTDKLLIHSGLDLFQYDIAMRNNNLTLNTPNQPNGFYWSNVSIGFNLGMESIDYITDDGIFYNLRLGYTFTPNSEWRGTSETFKSSLEYFYIGLGLGYDSGFKTSMLRR